MSKNYEAGKEARKYLQNILQDIELLEWFL
jgi:hypothetical protein